MPYSFERLHRSNEIQLLGTTSFEGMHRSNKIQLLRTHRSNAHKNTSSVSLNVGAPTFSSMYIDCLNYEMVNKEV
jgi:hypothetical protein